MITREAYRKMCLKQQSELRRVLLRPDPYERAIQFLLSQHAMLHSAQMAGSEPWSFEDEVFSDLTVEQARQIPHNGEHSVVWLIWHMARCEDITMNLLVAGSPQILLHDNWLGRLKVTVRDTGNAMDRDEMANFSNTVDIEALRAYRVAVGRRTREVIMQLQPADLKRKVRAADLQQVRDEGAVVAAADGIAQYWGKRDVAGLLLMPATRHNLVHLNEALEIKRKLR